MFTNPGFWALFLILLFCIYALFIFIPTNHILWPIAAFMAPANLIGGWIGARTALNRGSAFVRIVFLVMMGLMIMRLVMSL